MIMAKKPLRLDEGPNRGGMSARRCVMSQSSSIAHRSSHGPSRNACSAAVSAGAFADMSFCQFGPPVNNSPSHHTVPASSASRSVDDIARQQLAVSSHEGPRQRAHAQRPDIEQQQQQYRERRRRPSTTAEQRPTPSKRAAACRARSKCYREADAPVGKNKKSPQRTTPASQRQQAGPSSAMHGEPVIQIRSLTPSRSSSNSRCVACIFSRLNSLMLNPCTMLYPPFLQVTG